MIHECNTSSYEDKENICIPKNIFQTWHTKKLSPLMYKATQQIINANPEFNYSLYDDTDCNVVPLNETKAIVSIAFEPVEAI